MSNQGRGFYALQRQIAFQNAIGQRRRVTSVAETNVFFLCIGSVAVLSAFALFDRLNPDRGKLKAGMLKMGNRMLITSIETPLHHAASWFLSITYRVMGSNPRKTRWAVQVLLGFTLVAFGASLFAGSHPAELFAAAGFTFSGLVIGYRATAMWKAIPSAWTAEMYRRDSAIAEFYRAEKGVERVLFLFAFLANATVGSARSSGPEEFGTMLTAGVASMLFWITVFEYLKAAEPPPPDEGDGFEAVPESR